MIRLAFLLCLSMVALGGQARASTLIACQDANGTTWNVSPQHPCPTGYGVTTTNLSSTIAVTNTFQSIQVATVRNGCTIQNNSARTMWVYFGPIGSATQGASVQIATGSLASCVMGGIVLNDQISITGTAGDAFYAGVQ